MRPTKAKQTHVAPNAYEHSLDWRFLLPLGEGSRLLVLSIRNAGLSAALERAGISGARWREDDLEIPHSVDAEGANLDALALPFGLPRTGRAAHAADRILFYQDVRTRLRPDGYLLVGFENRWRDPFGRHTKYYSSTPAIVRDELQRAGFSRVGCFAVSPDLDVPDYVLQLQQPALNFAVGHRFRRSAFARNTMQVLLKIAGPIRAASVFPSYYVVGRA